MSDIVSLANLHSAFLRVEASRGMAGVDGVTIKDFGTRVQLSVFEAELDDKKLQRLKNRIRKVLNEAEDTLRLYPLCANCITSIEVFGQGVVTQDPDVIVI